MWKKILLYFALYIKHTHIPFSLSTYIAFNDNVVCSLYVHQHWAHICQLIIKIMFQMQTRELNPALKSFICRIQQPMTTNNVVYCYIRSIYIWLVQQTSGSSVTSCRKIVKCTFSFVNYVVCPSVKYLFWLPFWYLQTLHSLFCDFLILSVHCLLKFAYCINMEIRHQCYG